MNDDWWTVDDKCGPPVVYDPAFALWSRLMGVTSESLPILSFDMGSGESMSVMVRSFSRAMGMTAQAAADALYNVGSAFAEFETELREMF